MRALLAAVAVLALASSASASVVVTVPLAVRMRLVKPYKNSAATTAGVVPVAVTFDLNPASRGSGPSLLSSALTVAGTALTVTADYDGRDRLASTWPARGGVAGTLVEIGAGTTPTTGAAILSTEAAARGVRFMGSGNKYDDGLPTGIGTADYVVELVSTVVDIGGTHDVFADRDAALGWDVEYLAGGNMRFLHGDGVDVNVQFGVPTGAWNHLICFGKRTATLRCYVNGVNVTALDISARTGSMTTTNGLSVGGSTYLGVGGTGQETILVARSWKCAACLGTSAEMDAIALSRSAALLGYLAAAAVVPSPTSASRASAAYSDVDRDCDGTRRLFLVGNNALRTVQRKVGSTCLNGVISEPGSTNLVLQSHTLVNASWTKTNVTSGDDLRASPEVGTNAINGSDGGLADEVRQTATAGNVAHCWSQAPTLTAANYTASSWFRANTRGFAYVNDSTIANGAAWVDLSTCVAGTKQAGVLAAVGENWGLEGGNANRWCRFGITFLGTAAAHTIQFCATSADNVLTFDGGAGTAALVDAFGGQVEAQPAMTTYVATTTATATRSADDLRYDPSNTSTTNGTVEVQYVCPASNIAAGIGNPRFLSIIDATGSAPGLYVDPSSTAEARCEYYSSAVQQAQIISVVPSYLDGARHKIRATVGVNDARCFYDDAQIGATDTSVAVQAGATKFSVGNNGNGTAGLGGGQVGCFVSRVRAWPTLRIAPVVLP